MEIMRVEHELRAKKAALTKVQKAAGMTEMQNVAGMEVDDADDNDESDSAHEEHVVRLYSYFYCILY